MILFIPHKIAKFAVCRERTLTPAGAADLMDAMPPHPHSAQSQFSWTDRLLQRSRSCSKPAEFAAKQGSPLGWKGRVTVLCIPVEIPSQDAVAHAVLILHPSDCLQAR